MDHIGVRIRQYREAKKLTQADIFRDTGGAPDGIKQTTLSSIEGGTEPKAGVVSALLAAYPDLSPDWLLTGNGPMLRNGKVLAPMPEPPPTSPAASGKMMQVIDESGELKAVKDERDNLRKTVDQLLKILHGNRINGGSELGATGSFSSGNLISAASDPATAFMYVQMVGPELPRVPRVDGFARYDVDLEELVDESEEVTPAHLMVA